MFTSLSTFDGTILSRSLLQHAFYKAWSKGELTQDHLRIYAKEYFHLARRIPGIVASVKERAAERGLYLVDRIAQNEAEETEHVELWKRFAASLGVSEQELMDYRPSQTVLDAVADLEAVAREGFDEGVSAMYALEMELPAIAQSKKDGLVNFYGLTSKDAHVYFDEHLGEEAHLAVWRAVEVESDRATNAVDRSLAAQHKVLDGVCEACGLDAMC